MISLRKALAIPMAAVPALSMAACGSSSSSSASSGKAVTVNEKSAKATSLKDFGTMDDLVAAAEKEGALNVIALPHDWSDYGEVIAAFKKKYPKIKITELNPNASSKEEIDAGKTNKGTDAAPDVYDLGLAVASTNTEQFAPYKVQAWNDIPDSVKDADGKYYADYTGIMSIGWNADKYGDISSLDDLLDSKFAGTVALNGKPAEAGAAFNGFVMANQLSGGTIKNLQPGLDFFRKLKEAGTEYVATFIGLTNRLPGHSDGAQAEVFGQRIPLLKGSRTGDVTVLVRPENIALIAVGSEEDAPKADREGLNGIEARVSVIRFLGALVRVDAVLTGSGTPLTIQLPASELPPSLYTGSTVLVALRPVPLLAV